MNKKLTALLTGLLFTLFASAQQTSVRITVSNEKKEPVQNATVQILKVSDSSIIASKTIKDLSQFSLPSGSDFLIHITSVSITEIFKKIYVGTNDTTINFIAHAKAANLEGVVVTSKKPLITQDGDKTVVDAEVLANSSTNAYEVLEKTPGAVVDQDGNVYLNSATPAIIYINGREIKLGASDLASLLKSLPASSILKIEVLRTPSAKFDASGSGGIVNIVLKKGIKPGLNGSVEMSRYQGVYGTTSGGFNLNNSANKLNSYLSGNIARRNNFEVLESTRPIDKLLFTQSSFTRYPSISKYAGGGLDYEINKKWSVGYDARFVANNNNSHAKNNIYIDSLASMAHKAENISLINNDGSSFYFGNNFSSKYKIDSSGSEWENSADINFFNSKNNQDYSNIFVMPAYASRFGNGETKNNKTIIAFKSDLVLKLKKTVTIETGTKINFSNSRNNALYYLQTGSGSIIDNFQTNRFRYRENIGALYFQASKDLAGFIVKPGLRLEYTDIKGHQLFPADTTFKIKRTDLFPYVYLRHKLTKLFGFMLTGNAIYRRSIVRPYYEALNPYAKYVDQYTFDIGNPRLQPQFQTNYEFNITADDFPVFSIGLNDIKNIFSNLTYQDTSTKILYRTFDNLGTNKEFYLRMVGGIPPGGKYFFYAGAQYNHVNYNGVYNNDPFHYTNGSWTFFMYHNFKPIPTLNLSLNGFMRSNSVINFFELKKFGSLNFTANKSILKKKMNVVVSVNDMFRTNQNHFSINVPKFTGAGVRYGDTRRIGLTLKYNFGIRPKEDKKVNFEQPAAEPAN